MKLFGTLSVCMLLFGCGSAAGQVPIYYASESGALWISSQTIMTLGAPPSFSHAVSANLAVLPFAAVPTLATVASFGAGLADSGYSSSIQLGIRVTAAQTRRAMLTLEGGVWRDSEERWRATRGVARCSTAVGPPSPYLLWEDHGYYARAAYVGPRWLAAEAAGRFGWAQPVSATFSCTCTPGLIYSRITGSVADLIPLLPYWAADPPCASPSDAELASGSSVITSVGGTAQVEGELGLHLMHGVIMYAGWRNEYYTLRSSAPTVFGSGRHVHLAGPCGGAQGDLSRHWLVTATVVALRDRNPLFETYGIHAETVWRASLGGGYRW